MNSDFKELLKIFNEHQVRYPIIGGYAVMKYSEPRYTKDLDLWIEASDENAKRVFTALAKFGAPLADLQPSDFAVEGNFYQMGRPPVRVDILMSINGMSFAEAWERRNSIDFFGVTANIVSLEDLIESKRLAGRAQDLIDVENLLLAQKIKDKI